MLRRTAARAFAPSSGREVADVEPGAPRDRLDAVRRLFLDLRRELSRHAAAAGVAGLDRSPRRGAERSLLGGVEFLLESPWCALRFVDDLRGMVQVSSRRSGRWELEDVISVQAGPDGYRPIRKRVRGRRTGFRFTTVRELAGEFHRSLGPEDRGGGV